MKRLFAAALAAIASLAFGATTVPVGLISPVGSTSGQAIISTGATGQPAWGTVSLTGISGTLAIANGGTGATSAAAALTNLNAAALAANTFTGTQTAPTFVSTSTTNSTSSTTGAIVTAGGLGVAGDIYSAGSYHGSAFIGAGTISSTPISGSTGSFTTLAASGAVSGTGMTNFVASQLPSTWTAYTPTVSAASGTYTSASATGGYARIGKMVCMYAQVTITTVGTGGVTVITLPVTVGAGGLQLLPGRENGVSGKMLQGWAGAGATTMTIADYSGASAAANGALEAISGCYLGV